MCHNKDGRLRVFENMVLRRIFGPKKDEVTGEWEKTTLMILRVPQNAGNFLTGGEPVGFSRRTLLHGLRN